MFFLGLFIYKVSLNANKVCGGVLFFTLTSCFQLTPSTSIIIWNEL